MKDVVVLIPGIGGSALSKDGDGGLVVHRGSGPARRAEPRGDHQEAGARRRRPRRRRPRRRRQGDPPPARLPRGARPGLAHRRLRALRRAGRRAVRPGAGPELLRAPLRLAPRQPCRRAEPGSSCGRLAAGVAHLVGQRRREARPHRPLDGRDRVEALPRERVRRPGAAGQRTRGMALHQLPDHARHAVQRIGQRGRVPRERVQEGVGTVHGRPDRHDPLLHLGLPAAALVPLPAGRRRRPG